MHIMIVAVFLSTPA